MPTISRSYRAPSVLDSGKSLSTLALSAVREGREEPFFQAGIRRPGNTAKALACLSRVVGERWFDAAALADARRRMLDPIVTSGDGHLRFEGFSGCRSLYARVDLLPESLDVVHQSSGTTNVDFNQPMRTALSRVRDTDSLSLAIDENAFLLVHGQEALVEHKVELPLAWLKGLASIPHIESRCEIFAELSGTPLLDFFRSLPRTGSARQVHWLQSNRLGVRISRTPSPDAVQLTGLKRVLSLQDLIPLARKLTIAKDPSHDSTFWTLHLDGLRLTLALSPEVWRGFSGEGSTLDDLSRKSDPDLEGALVHQFGTSFEAADAAIEFGVSLPQIRTALAALSSQGQMGFDHLQARWFRRILPGNQSLIRRVNPRIAKAESWVAAGDVVIESNSSGRVLGRVHTEPAITHDVEIDPEGGRCTCFWHGRFGLSRGPCSHIIALRLAAQTPS